MTSDEIEALAQLDVDGLRDIWRSRLPGAPPTLRSRALLARALAFRLELAQNGAMAPRLKKRLTDLAGKFQIDPDYDPTPRRALSIGCTLVREWRDVRHIVRVTEDGFQYGDRVFTSLTHVAKAITGAHQSGLRFFGVVEKRARSA